MRTRGAAFNNPTLGYYVLAGFLPALMASRPASVSRQTSQSGLIGLGIQGSAQPSRTQALMVCALKVWPSLSNKGSFPPGWPTPRLSHWRCTTEGRRRGAVIFWEAAWAFIWLFGIKGGGSYFALRPRLPVVPLRPRPIFLAKTERWAAYFGATMG